MPFKNSKLKLFGGIATIIGNDKELFLMVMLSSIDVILLLWLLILLSVIFVMILSLRLLIILLSSSNWFLSLFIFLNELLSKFDSFFLILPSIFFKL